MTFSQIYTVTTFTYSNYGFGTFSIPIEVEYKISTTGLTYSQIEN